jgi:hypothetical protein
MSPRKIELPDGGEIKSGDKPTKCANIEVFRTQNPDEQKHNEAEENVKGDCRHPDGNVASELEDWLLPNRLDEKKFVDEEEDGVHRKKKEFGTRIRVLDKFANQEIPNVHENTAEGDGAIEPRRRRLEESCDQVDSHSVTKRSSFVSVFGRFLTIFPSDSLAVRNPAFLIHE